MNINLHIERLVLDGLNLGPGQGAQVKDAVEAELSRLLTEGGIAPELQGGTPRNLHTGSIRLASDANPQQIGRQIAGAVYGAIGQ